MPVSPDALLAFALASFLLIVIPGPTVLTAIAQALAHGRRVAFASVLGVGCGDLVAATLSVLGVGALLAASATVFTIVKWAGALYLVYLGVRMWRVRTPAADLAEAPAAAVVPRLRLFRDAFSVTVLNPKGIVFFVAFLPQFIATDRPYAPQAAMLVATFVLIAMLNIYGYVLLASRIRAQIRNAAVIRRLTRAGGAALVMAGFATLLAPRV